jgi:hypothetical protein
VHSVTNQRLQHTTTPSGKSKGLTPRGWWWRIVAVLGATCLTAASVLALTGSPAPAETPAFSNGQASASAQSFKVNPTAAALSIGVTFGQALAGYQNTGAKADARGIDLGIVGTLLSAAGCDGSDPTLPADQQPQPLQADSRDPQSNAGQSSQETIDKQAIPAITKSVKATPTPFAQADTYYAPVAAPGLIQLQGAHASAVADLVGGKTREAIATVDVGDLDIAGGLVKITGLHWEAVNRTGADAKAQGTFTMGKLLIAGQSIPVVDPSAALTALNQVLAGFGIQFQLPKVHNDNGEVVIDPLAIAVVPAAARDAVFGQILSSAQPVRQALTDAMLKASCKFGDVITVADITVGSVSGAGSFTIEVGGASASSGDLKLSSALQPIPDLSNNSNLSVPAGSNGGTTDLGSTALPAASLGTPAVPGTPGSPGQVASGVGGRQLARPIADTSGARGGMLAAVAAVGFGLLFAAIEGDRRMMRRAQRMIPEA